MSGSDSDLTVEEYDEQDNLNFYGSPIRQSPSTSKAPVVSTNTADRAVFCSCKNTCSRGSGRKKRGCPCRDENFKCTERCTCGTSKSNCKNNQEVPDGIIMTGSSAFERHEAAVNTAKEEITAFIATLDISDKDRLLVELLSNGKGSLDYAKNLVDSGRDSPPPPQQPQTRPTWCTCSVCEVMPSEEENKCCKKIRCVTSYITFQNTCTDRDVLTMAIRGRCDIRAEEPEYLTNSFRKAAYRQYILWRYKKLGRGNRRVCPSCVVVTIRHLYPAPDGNYLGFRRA